MARKSQDIIVQKKKSHRVGIRVFSIISTLMFGALAYVLGGFRFPAAMLFLLCSLPILLFWVYCETWQIIFSQEKISKKIFFKQTEYGRYHKIQAVSVGYLSSENSQCIRIRFSNGKVLHFRVDDHQASAAAKRLKTHCSIQQFD